MSLQIPTTAEINSAIISQLEATLNQTIPLLPKAFNRILAKTLAGVFILLHRYIGFVFLQMFVNTATINNVQIADRLVSPLKEWGRLIGIGEPTAATQARLTAIVTVEVPGGTLESGTQLLNSDNGVTYLTTASVELTAGTVEISILAAGDQTGGNGAGAIGNLAVGEIASFANPLANVARDVTVSAVEVTAANAEDTEVYRQRILDRFQKRVQGGALVDYEIWGEEGAGIINVYPYTGASPGEVDVYVEATVESSGDPDGIPTAAQLTAVDDLIQLDEDGLATRIPANAFANIFGITRRAFDIDVVGMTVTDPATVQTQITDEVTSFLLGREPFVSGVTLLPRRDSITKTALVGLVDDLVTAAGGSFRGVNFSTGGGGNLGTYILGVGEKAKVETVVFSP